MKTMNQWEQLLKDVPKDKLQNRLNDVLEDIAILESIYITGGKLNHFGQPVKDAAYNERQQLCQLSSALYQLLRTNN
jgi:hypothetical protein